MNTLQTMAHVLSSISYIGPYLQDRLKSLLAIKMVCMYIRCLIIYSTSAFTVTKHSVFGICSITFPVSFASFYIHALQASYSPVQDGPRRIATNPMLNHLEYLRVVALLCLSPDIICMVQSSSCMLEWGCLGCDRSSEYMREELTSGIIHPWAAFNIVEHVQLVQGYRWGWKRKLCFSKVWVCLPCCSSSFLPDAKER